MWQVDTNKINDEILKIFHLGKEQIKKSIASTNILYESSKSDFTGPEYFIVSNIDAYDLKKKMLDIEENSYFGRLYDIDVIYKDENITRKMIGGPSRKCFLCDNDAKACARSRNHSVDEMIIWIENIIDDYQGDLWKKER